MEKKYYLVIFIILLITVFNLGLVYFVIQDKYVPDLPNLPDIVLPDIFGDQAKGIESFDSVDDFKDYLALAPAESNYYESGFNRMIEPAMMESTDSMDVSMGIGLAEQKASVPSPSRYSETNVQVLGIDEPDIIKTDGKELYYSSNRFRVSEVSPRSKPILNDEPMMEAMYMPRSYGGTKSIKIFPPAELAIDGEIDKQGNLLLVDDILVIISNDKIYGYDVSNPAEYKEKWSMKLSRNNWVETARLYDNEIYLITRSRINVPRPCPFEPLALGDEKVTIACSDIYHPVSNIPVDSTYTVMKINPKNGQIKDKTAFVGSSSSSVIYMSLNAVYITYNYPGDLIGYMVTFFTENDDIIPDWVIQKLAKLNSYDISIQSKMSEFEMIMNQFRESLNADEMLKLDNEMQNRIKDFVKTYNRELEKTGIVKIDIDNLNVSANGDVPGVPLNQFSLDEYDDHLRIATTIGRGSFTRFFGRSESFSDVYVLDEDLDIIGSVLGLGETEKIYSVRFIQDKGYVVTFRQIDPFYVLDLSNPKNPELKGELKIPGFSSYLHPLSKDMILGIGEEDRKVKISIFDVSDPSNPTEKAKYNLDDRYSEISQTHHAFLLDEDNKIFFLPGSKGGYIFSYENNDLKLVKAVSEIRAKRALYVNDYLYVVGEKSIVVLNQSDWERVNELEL